MHKDSEIAKLTERISKDPKSKLFVPLAEEYKKTGDIEMSILVLQEGLKNNPAYVTARSFLGRLLIEKGDLPGAQKEFEEVIKAIPDNLMAHRKLGDIYALQGRPADALSRYKTVVALNPKDAESAMLIAEIEAGRDIKKHLFQPKPAATTAQQKQQEYISAPARPSAGPAASPQKTATRAEEEEPEEVLVVEPLDAPEEQAESHSLEQQLAKNGMEFLSETAQEAGPPGAEEETFAGADPFSSGDSGKGNRVPDAPAEPAEIPEKQADDFTTDTLAELYISQGFYEKAIDIYERMLVDKPNSQGLKDKLGKVRSMAASAGQETEPETAASKISGDLDPGFEAGEAAAAGRDPVFDSFVPPAAGSEPAPLDDWGTPPAGSAPAIDTPPLQARPQHFDVGFEPKEYVPPDAVRREQAVQKPAEEEAAADQTGEGKTGQSKNRPASKKETIERLEGWLRSITKEN